MAMKVLVPRQTESGETRTALVPAAAKKLTQQGLTVLVEAGAGAGSHHADEAYRQAGATVLDEAATAQAWSDADIVLTVQPPTDELAGRMKPGAVLAGVLSPLKRKDLVRTLAQRQVTSFAMEFVPRISRAQSMDVLSSQANIGGYKAVILAADYCPKLFPMMITAAGTIAPSKVFVIGAGVAGLQAIATARRLGAVVEAYDVRPAVKEQVQSLGARFVELPLDTADAATAGGYAKEQTDEQRRKQAELMARHVIASDAVIATAAVFGKAPPMLIPDAVVAQMSSGSVLVDLAADPDAGRGNCQATRPGQTYVTDQGVTIVGTLNLPGLMPVHASQVYAANMLAFLKEIVPPPAKGATTQAELKLNLDDEIQKGALITHAGQIASEMVRTALA